MAFPADPVKRKSCQEPKEQPGDNVDGVVKHAVDSGHGQEQKGQPVSDFHPFKLPASPPGYKKRNGNVGTWKGGAGIFSPCVNRIDHGLKQAALMKIFISQGDRSLNRQEYEDEKTQVEQGGKLEHEALEELHLLAE